MRKRLFRILIPICTIFCAATFCLYLFLNNLEREFRLKSNQRTAELVGIMAENNPDFDFSGFIKELQLESPDSKTLAAGEKILRDYGVTEEIFVDQSTEKLSQSIIWFMLVVSLLAAAVLIIYFWLLSVRQDRQISELVTYLQKLGDDIYSLRIDENREGELSLLTNELYKIIVTLKAAAEENQKHSRNLETALADISHQIRTPLTALQIMIDNINDDPDMPAEIRADFLHSISEQVDSMSSLVMTLLNLAKFDNDSITLHNQSIKVSNLFEKVISRLAALADLEDIKIVTTGDLDSNISLDLRWQAEALTNIVKNCLEHSPSGSKIILSAEDCPLFLRVTIQDFGEGISLDDLRHIFERFYKAKNSSDASIGIGLSFAKAIIEASSGQIRVKSKLGEGTTFIVTYFK